jgi:non-homologous end joining protein Ku
MGMTLRYPYQVRKEDEYFEDIPDEKIPKDMPRFGFDNVRGQLVRRSKHLKSERQRKSSI